MDRLPLRAAPLLLAAALGACAWTQGQLLGSDFLDSQKALYETGKYELVISRLDVQTLQRLRRKDRAQAYELIGQSHERLGDIDRALRVYQLAEGLYPKDINILSNLAKLLHRIGLSERAAPYYQRILAIHPHNATAHVGMAEIMRAQGMLPESAAHYEEAMKELDDDPVLWRDYAELKAEQRDFKGATAAITRSLRLAYDVDSLLDLALFERRQGIQDAAYRRIEEAARMAPGRQDLRLREALWRLEDGQADAAMKLAGKTLEKDPANVLARWIRASVHIRRGWFEAARGDLAMVADQRGEPFLAKTAAAMLKELDSRQSPVAR